MLSAGAVQDWCRSGEKTLKEPSTCLFIAQGDRGMKDPSEGLTEPPIFEFEHPRAAPTNP